MKRPAIWVFFAPPVVWLWVASASLIYCWLCPALPSNPRWMGRVDLLTFPYWQWFEAAPYFRATEHMTLAVMASPMPGALLIMVALRLMIYGNSKHKKLRPTLSGTPRAIEPAITGNHGNARFLDMEEAKDLFPGPHPVWGGVVVGEACAVDPSWGRRFKPHDKSTWGQGGKAPLLIDPCDDGAGHFILFSGSGWYKTSSLIPTILEWKTSCVVLDEAAEVGPMVQGYLQDERGKVVHFLNPDRPDGATTWGVDVLDWIDPNNTTFGEDVHSVVSWIYGQPEKPDPFFDPWAKDLITCLLADMLTMDKPLARKTLATLRRGLTTPEADMRSLLRGIYTYSNSMMARDIAGTLMDATEKQFSGIYGTAVKATSWLSTESLADLVSGNAFKTDDLIKGKVAIFIQIPADTLEYSPGVARVIVGALAKAAVRAARKGELVGKVLMLLDEVRLLRHMQVIENIRDLGRKSGLVLGMTYQTVGLLKEQWGPAGKEKWYSTVSWRGYCSVRDVATAEELAKECGQHGVLAYSEGDNTGSSGRAFTPINTQRSQGHNTNVHEISTPVAFLHTILSESRTDEMWVVGTGDWALRCSRAIYFRRPEMLEKVEVSKYLRTFEEEVA